MCHHRVHPGRDSERISGEKPGGGEEDEYIRIRPGKTYSDGETGCLEDGIKEGEVRGAEQQLSKIIKNMMKKGRSISQIAEELGEEQRIGYRN